MSVYSDMGASCKPEWAENGETCPYGYVLHVPMSSFTVHHEVTVLNGVAMALSCLPFILIIAFLGQLICGGRKVSAVLALILYFSVEATTLVLKWSIRDRRPEGSCMISCGMPSGHSSGSMAIFFWLFLKGDTLVYALPLLMVPWSRWELLDHSFGQICAGSGLGIGFALLYYSIMRYLDQNFPRWIPGRCCGLKEDNVFGAEPWKLSEDKALV